LLPIGFLRADVKTEEKSLVKFEGMLGKMMGLFGGKAAKEGTVNTVAVRGNRKAEMNDTTGTIIDLSEEKVYSLDLKKKTYEVATFADIRRKMLDAQEKAAKAAKEEPGEKRPQQGTEMEVDFSAKESGQTKSINGFDCREIIVTITTRQKGKTLEDAKNITEQDLLKDLQGLPESKQHCTKLAVTTLREAIEQYEKPKRIRLCETCKHTH
jgi:hypothetical protein